LYTILVVQEVSPTSGLKDHRLPYPPGCRPGVIHITPLRGWLPLLWQCLRWTTSEWLSLPGTLSLRWNFRSSLHDRKLVCKISFKWLWKSLMWITPGGQPGVKAPLCPSALKEHNVKKWKIYLS